MKNKLLFIVALFACIVTVYGQDGNTPGAGSGWEKYTGSPILGGELGTIFDVGVLKNDDGSYWMYNSWRNQKSIALSESNDGLHWSAPLICLPFNIQSGWQDDVNRVCVIKKDGQYLMWYTGQVGAATHEGCSWIGHATSKDGKYWKRMSDKPVMSPELPWENVAVMCPHVIWDEQEHIFKMWYSAGQQMEPNAIGYAPAATASVGRSTQTTPFLRQTKTVHGLNTG